MDLIFNRIAAHICFSIVTSSGQTLQYHAALVTLTGKLILRK